MGTTSAGVNGNGLSAGKNTFHPRGTSNTFDQNQTVSFTENQLTV